MALVLNIVDNLLKKDSILLLCPEPSLNCKMSNRKSKKSILKLRLELCKLISAEMQIQDFTMTSTIN